MISNGSAEKQKPRKTKHNSNNLQCAHSKRTGEMAKRCGNIKLFFLYPIHRILSTLCFFLFVRSGSCCCCFCSFSYSGFLLSLNMCNCEHKNVCLFASIVLFWVDWSVAHIFNTLKRKLMNINWLYCSAKQNKSKQVAFCWTKKKVTAAAAASTLPSVHSYQKYNAAMQVAHFVRRVLLIITQSHMCAKQCTAVGSLTLFHLFE